MKSKENSAGVGFVSFFFLLTLKESTDFTKKYVRLEVLCTAIGYLDVGSKTKD